MELEPVTIDLKYYLTETGDGWRVVRSIDDEFQQCSQTFATQDDALAFTREDIQHIAQIAQEVVEAGQEEMLDFVQWEDELGPDGPQAL